MKSLNELLDELEREFYDSKGFLWSKKSLIDVEKCVSLVEKIKSSVPSSVQDIDYLKSERNRIISSAERIVDEAEQRARFMVSETELVKRAEAEADKIKQKAIDDIRTYENNAMKRLYGMLSDIESFLTEALSIVRNSREDIELNLKNNSVNIPDRPQKKKLMTYDELIDSIE